MKNKKTFLANFLTCLRYMCKIQQKNFIYINSTYLRKFLDKLVKEHILVTYFPAFNSNYLVIIPRYNETVSSTATLLQVKGLKKKYLCFKHKQLLRFLSHFSVLYLIETKCGFLNVYEVIKQRSGGILTYIGY